VTGKGNIAFEGSDSVRVTHADSEGQQNGKSGGEDQEADSEDQGKGKGLGKNNDHGKKDSSPSPA
jgi:hypothetical protein